MGGRENGSILKKDTAEPHKQGEEVLECKISGIWIHGRSGVESGLLLLDPREYLTEKLRQGFFSGTNDQQLATGRGPGASLLTECTMREAVGFRFTSIECSRTEEGVDRQHAIVAGAERAPLAPPSESFCAINRRTVLTGRQGSI